LALGTAPLASIFWGNDSDTAVRTVSRALELGIGFFDTAPFYGLGEAERRLGRALAVAGGGIRDMGPRRRCQLRNERA